MTDPTRDIVAIGRLCADLQRTPRNISRATVTLGIIPTMLIDHVPYFDAIQIEHLTAYFRDEQPKR